MPPFVRLWFAASFIVLTALGANRSLVVISVDGLDQRYLRDADKLGLKIPNLRRLLKEGLVSDGVIGVMPTVTWPSHTTLISGVPPHVHGILNNRRPKSEGGDYYWNASLLKVRTLLDAVREKGLKSAAITWPVTVGAPVDFNLPEYFKKRRGGAMDLPSIESEATPGLVAEISRAMPSFAQEWMDDRTRTLATVYLLEKKRPDLLLLHLVDHDSEAHDRGPFTREANSLVEYSDELIGQILRVAGPNSVVAIVSDHGFERTDSLVNVRSILNREDIVITPFLLFARSESASEAIRKLASKPEHGIGREIPRSELKRYGAPDLQKFTAAWESAPHFSFGAENKDEPFKPRGEHGFWPGRPGYRSVFLLWGAGIKPSRLPELEMTDVAARFATILGIGWPLAKD